MIILDVVSSSRWPTLAMVPPTWTSPHTLLRVDSRLLDLARFSKPSPLRNPILPVPSTIKSEAFRRILIGQTDLAGEQAADAGNGHFHLHLVFVFSDFVQMVGSRHALGEHHGILQQLVGTFATGWNRIRAADFQAVLELATASARMV